MKNAELSGEDFALVMRCRLFDGCQESDVRRFIEESGAAVRTFSSKELIPRGERADCWGIVLQGSVRIYAGGDGGDLLINVVGVGQPFDIASLAGCGGREILSDAWTVGKCRIAFIRAMDTSRLTAEFPAVTAGCMAFFCERIGFLNRKLRTISRGNAERKLADFLLCEFHAEDGRAFVRVKSCVELAVRLNLSRASLYRAFDILENSGCISRSGKEIEILDTAALQTV